MTVKEALPAGWLEERRLVAAGQLVLTVEVYPSTGS